VIHTVTVRNFRALKELSVELRPLTVIIGPNDSGKSSFLDAIHRGTEGRIGPEDWWRHQDGCRAEVRLLTENANHFDGFIEIFKLPSEGIPMESEGVDDVPGGKAPRLEVTGANLAAFLDHLLRKDRRRFDAIQQTLRERVPGLEEVSITTPSKASRAITLKIEGGFEIAGQRLSTGVRMLFFFVALAHHPEPPDVALIEEPENGVHPRRLKDIVEMLRGMTEGKLSGHETQIILTTHSPYLLDHVRPPGDRVLVFRREADGRRTATQADDARLREFLDEFMLGEVWFNQGEEGLVTASR
jgi:predicted ATPase